MNHRFTCIIIGKAVLFLPCYYTIHTKIDEVIVANTENIDK